MPGAASLLKQASEAGIPKATRALRALERQIQAADTHAKHAAASHQGKSGDLGKPKHPLPPPSTSANSSAASRAAITEEKEDEEAAARAQAYREVHEAHAKAKAARASERASVESKLANAEREVATAVARRLEET